MGDARQGRRPLLAGPDGVSDLLLDFEAYGWVQQVEFAGTGGWALTHAGRVENERQLAGELAESDRPLPSPRPTATFLPLNARFQTAVTQWQIRPLPGDPMATNDHSDFRWDDRVLDAMGYLGRRLAPLCGELTSHLARFDGYAERYAAAMARVERGERSWVDGVGLDSCHVVWFELHEDLIATLGLQRGHEASGPSPG